MITNRKSFLIGLMLLISFAVIYAAIMSPIYGGGRNGLQYADDMFNSLSKGSANFLQEEMQKAKKYNGTAVNVTLNAADNTQATEWGTIYEANGFTANVSNTEVAISGDLGGILSAILLDSEAMYNNQGYILSEKYGINEREAMYATYNSLKSMNKAFDNQELFAQSAAIQSVLKKGVEPAYNYYGIEAKSVKDYARTVTFLMLFYLVYTLWLGFSIYFIFEGVGITASKAAKKAEA